MIVLGAALVRLSFLGGANRGVNSDEAWTGLMAMTILRGEYPVFMPGLGYMGSLEAYATAVVFWLFGSSPGLLSVTPIALSLLLVLLLPVLGARLWGETAGLWAAVFAAFQPVFLVAFGNAPRLGYVETLVWGTILFLLAERMTREPAGARNGALFLVFGCVTGLAVWTNLLVAPFVATTAVALLALRPRLLFRASTVWSLPGFIVGSAPFWVFNVSHHFWSFALLGSGGGGGLRGRMAILVVDTLPFALGLRDLSTNAWFRPAVILSGLGYAGLAFAVVVTWWREKGERRRRLADRGFLFSGGLFSLTLLAFMASRYGSLGSPRYLFPVYGALPLLLAGGVVFLRRYSRAWGLMAIPILIGNLAGVARAHHDLSVPGAGESEVPSLGPVVDFLRRERIERVYADYGISVRINFETGEKIVAADLGEERYPPYASAVDGANKVAIVAYGRFAPLGAGGETIGRNLGAAGLEFLETSVGGWRVYHDFRRDFPYRGAASAEIRPDPWRAETSEPRDDPRLAFDRDVTTRWGSGRPRGPGIFYLLDLGRLETPHRVVLLPGTFVTDHPVGLRVEASRDKRTWRVVRELPEIMPGLHVRGGQPRFDSSGIVETAFPPVQARYLRLTHLGEGPPFDWSIGEVFVFSPAPDGERREEAPGVASARRFLLLGETRKAREDLAGLEAAERRTMEACRLEAIALSRER
ncbi:MAG: discoidin domain-containing protein [Nitrospirae bacterium]|nr:discoidin domain-containing protein [Nitrospirota bacterium]